MYDCRNFYINGEWVAPTDGQELEVINPATEQVIGHISLGNAADVDRAVASARSAFDSFSRTTQQERIELLEAVKAAYKARWTDMGQAISDEMGAPMGFAQKAQAGSGYGHVATALSVLKQYEFGATFFLTEGFDFKTNTEDSSADHQHPPPPTRKIAA